MVKMVNYYKLQTPLAEATDICAPQARAEDVQESWRARLDLASVFLQRSDWAPRRAVVLSFGLQRESPENGN